ncbi:MAG: hydroxymethylbilane synthase [Acidimicrobiia bacterium]
MPSPPSSTWTSSESAAGHRERLIAASRPWRIATRGSRLALWQAERVARMLGGEAEMVVVSTIGDRRADVPVWSIGGTGVFVKEVEAAVLEGRADLAVHSAKDLPSETAPGLRLAAIPERADPRDALVGLALDAVPTGGRIGTGSVRRRAQLAALRPDLTFGSLRGNLETRVAKAADFDAVVVAMAAMERLGLEDRVAEVLDPSVMLPQVAQGALAVECRADDPDTVAALAALDDPAARAEVEAERAFLRQLGSGCDLACGALARARPGGGAAIEVLLGSLDGHMVLRTGYEGDDPVAVGTEAARILLDDCGGRAVLEEMSVPAVVPLD